MVTEKSKARLTLRMYSVRWQVSVEDFSNSAPNTDTLLQDDTRVEHWTGLSRPVTMAFWPDSLLQDSPFHPASHSHTPAGK